MHRYKQSFLDLKKPDVELDKLARTYAETGQRIFLCSLIEKLWASEPSKRPLEYLQNQPPARLSEQLRDLLKPMGALSGDIEMASRFLDKEGDDFINAARDLKAESLKERQRVEEQIKRILAK